MSHLYPLAASAADALASPEPAARTRYEAETLAGDASIGGLETEWISPDDDQAETYTAAADAGVSAGFVQRYEDASGAPVYAVTYWKLEKAKKKKAAKPAKKPASKAEDDTDELYFRSGRTKARKRKRARKVDPRQLDLFQGPDQKGYEYRDPDNPGVIIADEEGDGTSFGLAPKDKS